MGEAHEIVFFRTRRRPLSEESLSQSYHATVLYLEVSVLLEALLNSVNPKLPISVKSL